MNASIVPVAPVSSRPPRRDPRGVRVPPSRRFVGRFGETRRSSRGILLRAEAVSRTWSEVGVIPVAAESEI